MSSHINNQKPASAQFWILVIFIAVVFLTGGASRVDVQSLLLLRPLSFAACAVAIVTVKRKHLVGRKWLLGGFASLVMLCVLHLIPLPPVLWKNLPGRELMVEVDVLAGLGEVWRPLTLTPMNGWHSLVSLVTPLSVMLLGIQLNRDDLARLLPVLLICAGLSGFLGMLQIMGDPKGVLYLYHTTNNGTAVGLFANRNHAAVLLACLFPMLAIFASISKGTVEQQRMRQFAAIAGGIVLVPLILVTGSRSGMLMSFPALIGAALLYRKPVAGRVVRRGGSTFKFEFGYVIAASAVLSLALLTIFFSRAEAFDRLLGSGSPDDIRADSWGIGVKMFWTYFPFGSGIGSFVETYKISEPAAMLSASYVNHAHNDWLEIPMTGGVPAIIILLIAIGCFSIRTVKLWQRKDNDRTVIKMARLATVTIIIMALASITDYPLRTPIMMSVFAIFCLWLIMPTLDESYVNESSEGE